MSAPAVTRSRAAAQRSSRGSRATTSTWSACPVRCWSDCSPTVSPASTDSADASGLLGVNRLGVWHLGCQTLTKRAALERRPCSAEAAEDGKWVLRKRLVDELTARLHLAME